MEFHYVPFPEWFEYPTTFLQYHIDRKLDEMDATHQFFCKWADLRIKELQAWELINPGGEHG